ncbi:hypothetical protein EYF80_050985 [Liparis tanakae]|uniref:Uncharacterized protein n=1 Tax=Liparis tanakae TaxID=230148 RepID=A0A4Z2FDI5_9TELE|nr:hypothetical protein EYF80_050985 [Liparis tanakae]
MKCSTTCRSAFSAGRKSFRTSGLASSSGGVPPMETSHFRKSSSDSSLLFGVLSICHGETGEGPKTRKQIREESTRTERNRPHDMKSLLELLVITPVSKQSKRLLLQHRQQHTDDLVHDLLHVLKEGLSGSALSARQLHSKH